MRRGPRWTRHSIVLSVAGAIYVVIGLAFFLAPKGTDKAPSLKTAVRFLSLNGWGAVFVVCGVLALLAAFSTLGHKTWGYMVLTGLSSGWATLYVAAVVFEHAPVVSLISALTWTLLAFVWWGVSGLISPEHLNQMMHGHHESLYTRVEPD